MVMHAAMLCLLVWSCFYLEWTIEKNLQGAGTSLATYFKVSNNWSDLILSSKFDFEHFVIDIWGDSSW